jgi:hypothetical protein
LHRPLDGVGLFGRTESHRLHHPTFTAATTRLKRVVFAFDVPSFRD